jgi:hypothetical protein
VSARDKALAWLRTKQPRAVVGLRGRAGRCPTAELLRELAGAPDPAVYSDTYRMDRMNSPTLRLPGWTRRAEAATDAGGERDSPVTAAEALRLWEEIPE